MNLEKINYKLNKLTDLIAIFYFYVFIYSFSLAFILIGILLFSHSDTETPKVAFIILGSLMSFVGVYCFLLSLKNTLENYLKYKEEK
jgi:hypothetical protein